MRFIQSLKILIKPLIGKFPAIVKPYWYIRYGWKLLKKPVPTPLGFRLIGNTAMELGKFEPEETRFADILLKHVDVFVNIGANIGYYCCIALNSGKHTIAFEPMPLNLQYLYKNITANHWEDRIEVFPVALSNKPGIINIYGVGTGASLLKGWSHAPDSCFSRVPATMLDTVLGHRLSGKKVLFWVDIEGAEQYLLEGATDMLAIEPKPIWMVEICIKEHQPDGIAINPNLLSTFNIFWDAGYDAWTADKQFRCIARDEIRNIVISGVDSIQMHNFLFIEKGKKSQITGVDL
jgi:FkbM family methyltransferase